MLKSRLYYYDYDTPRRLQADEQSYKLLKSIANDWQVVALSTFLTCPFGNFNIECAGKDDEEDATGAATKVVAEHRSKSYLFEQWRRGESNYT